MLVLVLVLVLLPKTEGRNRVDEEEACLRGVERADEGPASPCPCCGPSKSTPVSAM